MKTLTIVVPAFNEERHIGALLERVLAVDTASVGFAKEVIVVDDGSRDGTGDIARSFAGVTCLVQTPNQGKGRAVRRGIAAAGGDYLLVQDADLEYDPRDIPRLLAALDRYDVVYGSRAMGPYRKTGARAIARRHPGQSLGPWLASVVLTAWTWLLYGRFLSDTLTGYKLYPTGVLQGLSLVTKGFETDHEITARLLRLGLRVGEVPIAYHPRSRAEGKKIRARDGVVAVVRVTHPFHPQLGQELDVAFRRCNWGEDRVFHRGPDGLLSSLPTRWTSLGPTDPYVVVAAGQSRFRVPDLIDLADLICTRRS